MAHVDAHRINAVSSPIGIGGIVGSTTSVKDAIDVLLYDDNEGQRKRKMVLELTSLVQKTDFAEQFLEEDGLDVLLQQIRNASGNMQAAMLGVLRGLLVYINAVEQIIESPELVDRIYGLLVPPPDGAAVPLNVAKPTLEILIVLCGMAETGYKLINKAAKKRIGANMLAYSPLIPLLGASDLLAVHSTLLFMNILMKKMKEASELKAKKLFFRWKECGILSLLKPLTAIEDDDIIKQLAYLQKQTSFTIPRSWEEASKYRAQYEEAKRKCDMATETLYIFQQQQAKMRMLKSELARAQETVRMLSIAMPATTTTYHPSRRFRDGGGLNITQLASNSLEPIDVALATGDIGDARTKVLQHFLASEDLRPVITKLVGPAFGGGMGSMMPMSDHEHYDLVDEDDELPPPPDDDDEDGLPPPPMEDDDDLPPPPMDDDDDDIPPPSGAGAGAEASPATAVSPASPASPATPSSIPPPPPPPGAGGPPPPPPPGAIPPAPGMGGPPPPPPPPGLKGGPPPPPPMFGKKLPGGIGGVKAAPKKPEKQFFRGPAPTKKMKPLHWDKLPLPENPEHLSVWHRIDNGTAGDTAFDYTEFEQMFSQKEVEVKAAAAPKPKKVMLLPDDVNRNLSIVLHKLPSIPNVQRALLELDSEVLTRDALTAMLAHAPSEETKSAFLKKASLKPEEEYEPQEKYMAMMITMPDFKRRVAAWLFSMEWEDSRLAVVKPIQRLQEAMSCVLDSKYLPYYLGLLLGFGNMMNYGDARKGNAGAVQLSLLGKLEMTKDNRGKTSLLSHLITTAKTKNPASLELPDELKPLQSNIQQIKWDDIEKAMQEAQAAVKLFTAQRDMVKKRLIEAGTDSEDPFIPYTTEFGMRAANGLSDLEAQFELLKETRVRFLFYFGITDERRKPEEVFAELIPFADKVKKAVQDMAKETRRNAKKGLKLGDGHFAHVVEKLQEEIVA